MKFIFAVLIMFSVFAKTEVSQAEKKQMIELLSQNDKLFESFFDYNAANIEKEAKALVVKFKGIKSEKFKEDLNRGLKYLSKISKTSTREDNNKNYHITSSFLIKLINKYDFGPKYQAYYCPMVKKKWIQDVTVKSKVHNPYDPSMPHCGGRL